MTPNVGRVEVRYDDVWANVCYEGEGDKAWGFDNVQVLCRQLGFPGAAMIDTKGSHGNGTRKSIINDYRCRRGKALNSWQSLVVVLYITSNRSTVHQIETFHGSHHLYLASINVITFLC